MTTQIICIYRKSTHKHSKADNNVRDSGRVLLTETPMTSAVISYFKIIWTQDRPRIRNIRKMIKSFTQLHAIDSIFTNCFAQEKSEGSTTVILNLNIVFLVWAKSIIWRHKLWKTVISNLCSWGRTLKPCVSICVLCMDLRCIPAAIHRCIQDCTWYYGLRPIK